jgi:hypothetical protein
MLRTFAAAGRVSNRNMLELRLHTHSLLRCKAPFRSGSRGHAQPLPPVSTSYTCKARWSAHRRRAGVDEDPYYNLFKSKVFQSDLVVKEFDRYSSQAQGHGTALQTPVTVQGLCTTCFSGTNNNLSSTARMHARHYANASLRRNGLSVEPAGVLVVQLI